MHDSPEPIVAWDVKTHLAVVGSMKTGKSSALGHIIDVYLEKNEGAIWLVRPERDTRLPDGSFRTYGDLLCAARDRIDGDPREGRLLLVKEKDVVTFLTASSGHASSSMSGPGSPPPPPGLILAEESHLLHPTTQDLLMDLVEGRHPEPPPGVVLVSIFRGIFEPGLS